MSLAAQRGRIAALTAAALLALFAVQPLHGAAVAIAGSHTATSIAADPGVTTPGAHGVHLCPLCSAANQARVAMLALPVASVAPAALHPLSIHVSPLGPAHTIALCTSGPRAPPRSLAPLV